MRAISTSVLHKTSIFSDALCLAFGVMVVNGDVEGKDSELRGML